MVQLASLTLLSRGKFSGMMRRDWTIFISSPIISNVYWTLACYMGITLVEWGWGRIIG